MTAHNKYTTLLLACFSIMLGYVAPIHAQETVTDVLNDRSLNMKLLSDRAMAVKRIKAIEEKSLEKAKQIANRRGMPFRENLPNGRSRVLVGVDDDGELLYYEDRNANAAISTAANKLYTSPYSINGSGVRVGVWENDSPRSSHQEFNDGPTSRINLAQSTAFGDHATHVAGIIGAFGVDPSAKGMAYQTIVDAYTSGSDTSEMTAAGATSPGQHATKLYVSNHSYGYTYGWKGVTGQPITWSGTGTDQNAYDPDFGKYNGTSRSFDSVHYNTPYYLAFWAAGNENTDGPSSGAPCVIGGNTVNYDPSIHPQNDGQYSGGFDTLGDQTTAKNVMVIGAANDAVTGGQRDPSKATIASFSSTGPCDDGRIKPDVVGNGLSVYSTISTSDTSYVSLQGTSMATPNVCGTAALLVDLYRSLNSGGAMRASTLRGLLIHTATDIGRPGPDYTYGWGLVDAEKAAQLIKRQADFPDLKAIVEDQVTPAEPVKTVTFSWDGTSPIRATLAWTDPAGVADTGHNNRTPDLVNDLNLKLIAPDGTEYFPFVMPFVGTWTIASMSANATTDVNHVDNVEQVLINSPGQAGAWQAQISYTGPLTNNIQQYGLLISGSDSVGALAFSPASYTVNESAGTATISVSRVGGISGAASVDYSTSNGTANAGSDYTATSGTLNWNNGEAGSKTFNIPILNDGISETYAETVQVTLSNPSGLSISATNPAILTILDDETLMGVTSFNSGGTFAVNTSQNITWASSLGGNVRIELLKNGLLYTTIAASTPNDGAFSWTIPTLAPASSDYSIRITSLAGGDESDVSDGVFSILNVANSTFYTADMSTNPGWTLEGLWAYGKPTGGAGISGGQRDPTAGFTGSNVIGYNLAGPYENNLPERYATTPAINCSGRSNVQLRFYRWLNVESNTYDNAKILVSNNGTSWTPVFANTGTDMTATSWSLQTYDISAVADGQPTVYIRWVMGTTDGSFQFTGWNIDDVTLTGDGSVTNPAGHLAFSSANFQVIENAGSATITVNRTLGTTGAISVDYSTSNGTATSASDYTATSGTLSWANGDSTPKTFSVPITNDAIREDFLETLTLTLTNTVGATLEGTNPATLTIQDDDNLPPTVNAGIDKTVSLSEVVPWSPSDTTTALWLDANDSTTITPNGATVSAWADKSGNGRNATQSTATAQPAITAAGLGGKNVLTFDGTTDVFNIDLDFLAGTSHSAFVVLANPTAYSNIYGAANGSSGSNSLHVGFSSATNYRMNFWGHDYAPAVTSNFVSTGSILNYVWPVGSSKQIFANGKLEATGGQVALAPGTMAGGGRIGRTTNHPFLGARIAEIIMVTGTVSAADRERFEGYLAHKWGLTANLPPAHPYKTTVPGGSGYAAPVALSDASVTEPEGDSYIATWSVVGGSPFVTFANPNAVNTTATFTAAGTYLLSLTASDGSSQSYDEVEVTVSLPSLAVSIADAETSENGTTTATISRSGTVGDLVVTLNSSDSGEATVPATATILDGNNSVIVTVSGVLDGIVDGTQSVTITATAAGFTDGSDTVGITDADIPNPAGHVAFSTANFQVSENAGSATITVNRTLGTTGAISVDYSTSDGTASAGSDYTATSGTLNWADGDAAPKTFSIPITNDAIRENLLESLTLTLTNTVGATLAGTNPATLTIEDDDNVPPSVNAGPDQTVALTETAILWTPASITTAAWYDAADAGMITQSGGTVSQWADKSGNNHHVTQSTPSAQPTYGTRNINSLNVCKFDGVDDKMTVASRLGFAVNPDMMVIGVMAMDAASQIDTRFWNIGDGGNLLAGGGGTDPWAWRFDGGNEQYNSVALESTELSAWMRNAGSNYGASRFFQDGTEMTATRVSTSTGVPTNTAALLTLGAGDTINYLNGVIGELIFLSDLTTDTRQKLEGYLAHKWGTTANLPAGHPYKGSAPMQAGTSSAVAALAGSANDANNDPLTTIWSVVSKPTLATVTFGDASALNTTATFSAEGTYVLQLLASDGSTQGSDLVTITVGPPVGPVDHFAISTIASPQIIGTVISGITITAQDATNATVTSFTVTVTFGGTAGITGTSANFVAGVLSGVSVTPAIAGSNLSFTANDGAGHTGSATFTVQSLYEQWAGTEGLAGGDAVTAADPDGDSLTNLQEYAFGMDPESSTLNPLTYVANGTTTPGLPILENTGTQAAPVYRAVFVRRIDHIAAILSYHVEFSANLIYWKPSAAGLSVVSGTSPSAVEAVAVPFPITVPLSGAETEHAPPRFFRVIISND